MAEPHPTEPPTARAMPPIWWDGTAFVYVLPLPWMGPREDDPTQLEIRRVPTYRALHEADLPDDAVRLVPLHKWALVNPSAGMMAEFRRELFEELTAEIATLRAQLDASIQGEHAVTAERDWLRERLNKVIERQQQLIEQAAVAGELDEHLEAFDG